MSIGVRLGSALLLASLVSIPPLRAETATWTDPPAREEASGAPPATRKPADRPATEPAIQPGPARAEPGQARAAGGAVADPAKSDLAKADLAKADRTRAAPRRAVAARPVAARSSTKAVPARRSAAAARPARAVVADRAPAPRRIAQPRIRPRLVEARPVEARRVFVPAGEAARFPEQAYPDSARRAGWDGLLGDERARRIARAREAGYLVMRAREVVYPDGRVVRTLHPLGPHSLGPNSLGPMGEGGPD